jgi:hypothetical protein
MTLKQRFKALVWQLKIAIMLVALEASIMALVSLSAIPNFFLTLKDLPTFIAIFAIFVGATLGLFFVARQLIFLKRWARSAAFFWQLIQLAVAWNSFTGEWANYYIGGYLVITSLATIYFLFTKEVVEATQEKVEKD